MIIERYSLFLLSILIITACNKTDVEKKKNISFDEIFTSITSVSIGENETSFYSLQDLIVKGDYYIMLDKAGTRIALYNSESKETVLLGNKGRGPKEFLSPELLIDGTDSTYFVLDGMGNFRISHFTISGELLSTFPLNSFGPFTNSYYLTKDNKPQLYITTATNCIASSGKNCIVDVLNDKGDVLYNFAETNRIEDKPIGLPYYSVVAGSEIFVVHVYSSNIYKYTLDGDYKDDFTILDSEYVTPPDLSNLSKSTFEQVNQLRQMSYTAVSGLYTTNEYLIVEYLRKGEAYSEKGLSRYFIEFYDLKGNLLLEGVNTDSKLYHVKGNEFYFANIDDEGKVNIEKYRYNNELIVG